jgi:hypothetical protein
MYIAELPNAESREQNAIDKDGHEAPMKNGIFNPKLQRLLRITVATGFCQRCEENDAIQPVAISYQLVETTKAWNVSY